jgi:hypothetical protein
MRKIGILVCIIASGVIACNNSDSSRDTGGTPPAANSGYDVTLSFKGPSVSPNTLYVCWIEDESGTNLQNIYVCNREMGIGGGLTGTPLPYWKTTKYTVMNSDVSAVTGASIQGSAGLSITRTLNLGTVKKFRVCFEIDRSVNSNTYFGDRPSFIYRSAVIDLDALSPAAYTLSLYGWMSNDTLSGTYSQNPVSTILGWAAFTLMTDLSYIAPDTDMVSTLTATVAAKK